jgi:TatD DNase family protein
MNFFDSHAHLTDLNAYENIDEVIKRANIAKVTKIINICSNKTSLENGIKLNTKYNFIYNASSSSPHDVEKDGSSFFRVVEKAALDKKIIAIGESGLDYYYEHSKKEIQKDFLIKYLSLAKKYNLPIILHVRDAFLDAFKILDEHYINKKTLLHCFTGNSKEALDAISRGWFISFSGIVTFKNSQNLRDTLKLIPIEKILIETDSPFLAPQSIRGKKNEPAYVVEVAECIANVKNMTLEDVAKMTFENTVNFFGIR